ncbi:MAG: hypothetical protein QXR48_02785 [Candidatus Woesearchaeota archaeon]
MHDIASDLAAKGWSKAEVRKATDIMAHAEASKTATIRFIEQMAFWLALFIAIFGNFIVSVVLVPFLLLLTGIGLYFTVFVVGAAFGLIFNVLIHYIEDLEESEHIIAGAFIPALALINIYLITHFTNKLEVLLQLHTPAHSPFWISVTYVFAFTLPYLVKHLQHLKQRKL